MALIEDIESKIGCFQNLISEIIMLKADKNSENARYFNVLLEVTELLLKKINSSKLEFKKKG